MTEKQCRNQIIKTAKLLGWKVHTQPKTKTDPGWPNLILVRGNQLWFIQTKTVGNPLTPEEKAWLDALSIDGAVTHIVWCPDGLDAFLTTLARPTTVPT